MPDPQPVPRSRFKSPLILLAVSAFSILLSIGLCNVGGFSLEGSGKYPVLVNLGVITFLGGIVGGGVSILWLIIAAIFGRHQP